jgi:hypothetical protein
MSHVPASSRFVISSAWCHSEALKRFRGLNLDDADGPLEGSLRSPAAQWSRAEIAWLRPPSDRRDAIGASELDGSMIAAIEPGAALPAARPELSAFKRLRSTGRIQLVKIRRTGPLSARGTTRMASRSDPWRGVGR